MPAVQAALSRAGEGRVGPETIEALGEGWVAEEALAISLYCALAFPNDFESAVLLAVNHSGDSDSTGAITGNLMGAILGERAIPERWLEELELRPIVARVADEASAEGLDGNFELAANWYKGEFLGALNRDALSVRDTPVSGEALNGLLRRIIDGTVSGKTAKEVFEAMWAGEGDPDRIIEERGLQQITDTAALAEVVERVIADNPKQVDQYRAGKQKLIGYFVGQVMQATGGKANPAQVNQLLREKLGSGEQ